jgi:hypothetical protein
VQPFPDRTESVRCVREPSEVCTFVLAPTASAPLDEESSLDNGGVDDEDLKAGRTALQLRTILRTGVSTLRSPTEAHICSSMQCRCAPLMLQEVQ